MLDEDGNVVEVQEYDAYGKTTFYYGHNARLSAEQQLIMSIGKHLKDR